MLRCVSVALRASAGTTTVRPPGEAVTVYWLTGEPPSSAGSTQLTSVRRSPGTALTPVGADGAASGTTGALGADDAETPTSLAAVTLNV